MLAMTGTSGPPRRPAGGRPGLARAGGRRGRHRPDGAASRMTSRDGVSFEVTPSLHGAAGRTLAASSRRLAQVGIGEQPPSVPPDEVPDTLVAAWRGRIAAVLDDGHRHTSRGAGAGDRRQPWQVESASSGRSGRRCTRVADSADASRTSTGRRLGRSRAARWRRRRHGQQPPVSWLSRALPSVGPWGVASGAG